MVMNTVKRNYGVLTDTSKTINEILGDRSGRTVSMRTAQGFKKTIKLSEMSDNTAEDIVHTGMVASGALLISKNPKAKVAGLFLLLGLISFYQYGR